MNTTVELRANNGETELVVTQTIVKTRVYTRDRRRRPDQNPLGRCLCPKRFFDLKGAIFETNISTGLDALIKAGILARPLRVYCIGEHIEVTYATSPGSVSRVWLCTNETPAVILAWASPTEAWCCDSRIKEAVRDRSGTGQIRDVEPTRDGRGNEVGTIPLVLHANDYGCS